MDAEIAYLKLKNIALREFPDIVVSASVIRGPLNTIKSVRMFFIDDSFMEVWLSEQKYSYHWQRTNNQIFRHDNAPHKKHERIKTFPKHFHDGSEGNVKESNIDDEPEVALREFLNFVRKNVC